MIRLLTVEGRFWRAMCADRLGAVLDAPGPESAGRYHRPGQPALHVTRHADWATIALGVYLHEDGAPRLAVPLEIEPARLVDQRDPDTCRALGIDAADSALSWRAALAAGEEPPSWRAADAARAAGADGIVDPSRGIEGGWHAVLFRWNVPGAPSVRVTGSPEPCDYAAARARWPSPAAWVPPQERVGR